MNQLKESERLYEEVVNGAISINKAREAANLKPIPEPQADEKLIIQRD